MPMITYIGRASPCLVGLEACSLTIFDATLSERAVSLFTPRMNDHTPVVPFPCLVDLGFHHIVAKDGVISSMIDSRSTAGMPLWAFSCRAGYGPLNSTGYPKDEEAMQNLVQRGLQLCWNLDDE